MFDCNPVEVIGVAHDPMQSDMNFRAVGSAAKQLLRHTLKDARPVTQSAIGFKAAS